MQRRARSLGPIRARGEGGPTQKAAGRYEPIMCQEVPDDLLAMREMYGAPHSSPFR